MIRNKEDAEWHVRLWKISLKARDDSHPATSLWDIFHAQAERIKKRIDDFIEKNPDCSDILEENKKPKNKKTKKKK